MLRAVQLNKREKKDPKLFCAMYKEAIYGNTATFLKSDLFNCRQEQGESISEYIFRLRSKSSVAYLDSEVAEENCLLAFLQLATRIDGVEKMMTGGEAATTSHL